MNRGFKSHVGYLCGAENYDHGFNEGRNPNHDCSSKPAHCVHDMWHNNHTGADIIDDINYSTNYYARTLTSIINTSPKDERLALFLLYQGVHIPYQPVLPWEDKPYPKMWDHTYANMLAVVDDGIKNITTALRATGRWNSTLIVVTADNGGIDKGNNFPLRGHKATTWEGGSRVMAFVAGGFLEAVPNFDSHLKGTTNDRLIHVSDWYPTFANLAGVDPTDNATYAGVVRPIDGIDVWPLIVAPAAAAAAEEKGAEADTVSALASPIGHNGTLVAITEATGIWNERYKLNQNAQSTFWATKNGTHIQDNRTAWPCRGNQPPSPSTCSYQTPGFSCAPLHYCGPQKSFFWEGTANLSACAAACAKAIHGDCHCFDWQEKLHDGHNCRLHPSSTGITRSDAGWNAYSSNGADAREWVQTMGALSVRTTAHPASSTGVEMPASMLPGGKGKCNVCTNAEPCLFDLYADPEERVDISKDHPELVKQLQAALAAAKNWTINGKMNASALEAYDCVTDTNPWWGDFSGPCCKPKQ